MFRKYSAKWTFYLMIVFLSASFSCSSKNDSDSNKAEEKSRPKSIAHTQKFDTIPPVKVEKKEDIMVVNKYPHDPSAFTQGLYYLNGVFYESTGQYGSSSLRKVDPETGNVLKKVDVPFQYFAEGMTVFKNKIYQITWTSGVCFVYDLKTFSKIKEFSYGGEGWGLTQDDKYLIMSDGTNMIRFIDPESFKMVRSIVVTDESGNPVHYLNELEYIRGEIWANVWQSDRIVRINPQTGKINSTLDISSLWNYIQGRQNIDVLNGIAYDKDKDRIFLTGKYWPYVFEVKLNQ